MQNMGVKRTFAETQVPAKKPVDKQIFSEAEMQEMMGNTDLLDCYNRWAQEQGSSYQKF